MDLEKIKITELRPMSDIIYKKLRQAILEEKFKTGERLIETNIADLLGVSRTPIREAFKQLEADGLIKSIPRKGVIVQGVSLEDALEIYEIREALEGMASRLACKRISKEELQEIRSIITSMETSIEDGNDKEYKKLHINFNNKILEASRNKKLIDEMNKYYEYLISLRNTTLKNNERRKEVLQEHIAIINAIESGDEDLAENLTRKHIRRAKEIFYINKSAQI